MDEPRGTSHTASASTDTSVWAHLAHHFEVARDAAEPVPSLGVNVPMRQVVQVDTIVRLRRYNTAIEPVWNNGYSVYTLYNEDDGPLPDEPPEGGMARLFGMPGVGKTEWLHFMAIPFLKQLEDDGAGVMVFDHATGYQRRAVLVPQNLRGRYKGQWIAARPSCDNGRPAKCGIRSCRGQARVSLVGRLQRVFLGHCLGHEVPRTGRIFSQGSRRVTIRPWGSVLQSIRRSRRVEVDRVYEQSRRPAHWMSCCIWNAAVARVGFQTMQSLLHARHMALFQGGCPTADRLLTKMSTV